MFRRKRKRDDFDAEIEAHLQFETEGLREAGLDDEAAQTAAHRTFGNTTRAQEQFYESGRLIWWDRLRQDIHIGARMLRKNPGFTIVAVLTLALGIGANTLIFSVIDSVMLRSLPFSSPNELARIFSTKNGALLVPNGSGRLGGPSVADMRDFAQASHSFERMAVYDTWRKNVSFGASDAEPEQMWVGLMPGTYFETLDLQPIMGRFFTEDEGQEGKNYVAAISAQLWKRRFGGDTAILGRTIRINDESYSIIAVMPDVIPEWMEAKTVQIWTPLALPRVWTEAGRDGRGWGSIARMKPGVSVAQAQADLAVIAAQLAKDHPVDQGIGVEVQSLAETRARNLRPMLFLLMAAVSLILLIACVNLANLLLARNSVRERELAMRAALGAGNGRLIAQLLAETLLLSLMGGGVGMLLGQAGVSALASMHPDNLPQLSTLVLDWRVLIFTLVVCFITALVFGLGPAVAGSRLNLVESLKLGSRSATAGTRAQRMRNVLVVTEMAMCLMLLVGASLVIQSAVRLQKQTLGIRQDHLLRGRLYLPGVRYPTPGAITRFSDQFAERVRSIPSVLEASVTTVYPPHNGWTQMLEIPRHPVTRLQDVPSAQFGLTDAHYLRTMGISLIDGRDFAESDNATTPAVALISEELKRRYFPTENPINQRIHIGPPKFLQFAAGSGITDSADVTIIGVIGDFRNGGLDSPPQPLILGLYSQNPIVNYGFKDIMIRTVANPHSLVPEIARQLHALDPEMPFAQPKTMDELVQYESGSQRFTAALLGSFAAAGLLLAGVGIYGVVSFLVAQRRREIAVRVAVGASVTNVLWLVLRQGLRMAAIGASIGLIGAWAAQKLLNGLLFGISAVDLPTFAASAVFLMAVVMIACWLPAIRAARVDPCVTLRAE